MTLTMDPAGTSRTLSHVFTLTWNTRFWPYLPQASTYTYSLSLLGAGED